jgi:hypothetical protein
MKKFMEEFVAPNLNNQNLLLAAFVSKDWPLADRVQHLVRTACEADKNISKNVFKFF